jgi:hypothetical protein
MKLGLKTLEKMEKMEKERENISYRNWFIGWILWQILTRAALTFQSFALPAELSVLARIS